MVFKPVFRDTLEIFHRLLLISFGKSRFKPPTIGDHDHRLDPRMYIGSAFSLQALSTEKTRDTYYETGLPAKLARRWGQMKRNSDRRGKNILCCAD